MVCMRILRIRHLNSIQCRCEPRAARTRRMLKLSDAAACASLFKTRAVSSHSGYQMSSRLAQIRKSGGPAPNCFCSLVSSLSHGHLENVVKNKQTAKSSAHLSSLCCATLPNSPHETPIERLVFPLLLPETFQRKPCCYCWSDEAGRSHPSISHVMLHPQRTLSCASHDQRSADLS
jgi:hypothetical protein